MSSKSHRSGGKYSGSHTTIIPTAAGITDLAHKQKEVSKIGIGYIKTGLSPSRRGGCVKIGCGEKGRVLLQIRGNTTQQEIHVWTSDVNKTKLAVARGARDLGMNISFEKSA